MTRLAYMGPSPRILALAGLFAAFAAPSPSRALRAAPVEQTGGYCAPGATVMPGTCICPSGTSFRMNMSSPNMCGMDGQCACNQGEWNGRGCEMPRPGRQGPVVVTPGRPQGGTVIVQPPGRGQGTVVVEPGRGQGTVIVEPPGRGQPGRGQGTVVVEPGRGQGTAVVEPGRGQGTVVVEPGRGQGEPGRGQGNPGRGGVQETMTQMQNTVGFEVMRSGDRRAARGLSLQYLGWDNTRNEVRIEGAEFVIAPNGDFNRATRAQTIDFIGWDGQRWSARVNGLNFSIALNGDWNRARTEQSVQFMAWDNARVTVRLVR